MHTDIDYSNLEGEKKEKEALKDIREWFGTKGFNQLSKEFKAMPEITYEAFRMYMSLGGVQGYPVSVYFKYLWPNRAEEIK